MPTKPRILLKLSGANLKKEGDTNIFTHQIIKSLVSQVKELSETYSVALVVGGGNIWRGAESTYQPLRISDAHTIGMLATIMNAITLQNYLREEGVNSTIFSAFSCPKLAEDISTDAVDRALKVGDVVIFAGGTGMPFVSTDTCAAVRSLEINAQKILIGKNGIKGIYDCDPKINPNARLFNTITYEEIIDKRLLAMDLASMILLKDNSRPKLVVFDQSVENAFVKAAKGEIEHTEVC